VRESLQYSTLTLDDRDELRSYSGCGICRRRNQPFLDHCHKHDLVRGNLCYPCNRAFERVVIYGMTPRDAVIHAYRSDLKRSSDKRTTANQWGLRKVPENWNPPVKAFTAWLLECPACKAERESAEKVREEVSA
jgi:Recombination endonuclease VII